MFTSELDRWLELADRYAKLGLISTAIASLQQTCSRAPTASEPLRRLVELALASGRTKLARASLDRLVKLDVSLETRLLHGKVCLVVGELSGARFALTAVIDAPRATPLDRANAMLGRARVAEVEGDLRGAAAQAVAAAETLIDWLRKDAEQLGVDPQLAAVVEEALALAVALGRSSDIGDIVEEARGATCHPLLSAMWLTARQVAGDRTARDRDVLSALDEALVVQPKSLVARIRRSERVLRRRLAGASKQADAITDLEDAAEQLAAGGSPAEAARVALLLAQVYRQESATLAQAAEACERALALQPTSVAIAAQLADTYADLGRLDDASLAIGRALRVDAEHVGVWLSAVRLARRRPGKRLDDVDAFLTAAAGSVEHRASPAHSLAQAAASLARDEALTSMHARGHRLKNLLGIIGVRLRSARKQAGSGDLADSLVDLETAHDSLLREWGEYLRTMQTEAVMETIAIAPLLKSVVRSAREVAQVDITLDISGIIPTIKGDRLLLTEALTSVIMNAVQACEGGGDVRVAAKPGSLGAKTAVEVVVADSGAGIPVAVLGQVTSPGFTTKSDGSGIGLAVADRVINSHYGRILIDSEEGQGTTVTIQLPGVSVFSSTSDFVPL